MMDYLSGRSSVARRAVALLALTSHRLLLAGVFIYGSMVDVVEAEEPARLPDGRTVIEIFGQELAFRPEDTDHVYLPRHGLPIPAPTRLSQTLADFLDYPILARFIFGAEERSVLIWVTFGWPPNEEPFLGRFDKGLIPRLQTDNFRIAVYRKPHPYGLPREVGSPDLRRGFTGYDSSGYALIDPSLWGNRSDRSPRGYILPGAKRIRPSSVNLAVWCQRAIGGSGRQCSTTIKTEDRRVAAGWRWSEDQFPQETWRDLDQRLREIVDHILINEPSGELE